MTRSYRELEQIRLDAGFGVRLVDAYTRQSPIGGTQIYLDVEEAGTWRALPPELARPQRATSGVIWFPWLERHRVARGVAPRKYRVRVVAERSTPAYLYDAEGVEVLVAPHGDAAPAGAPVVPVVPVVIEIELLPAANYPFDPGVPVLHGAVEDVSGARVARALVRWIDPELGPPLVTDEVLSDEAGEFRLPMRRAPRATPIDIIARRPPPPDPGKRGTAIVQLPAGLPTFLTMQIL